MCIARFFRTGYVWSTTPRPLLLHPYATYNTGQRHPVSRSRPSPFSALPARTCAPAPLRPLSATHSTSGSCRKVSAHVMSASRCWRSTCRGQAGRVLTVNTQCQDGHVQERCCTAMGPGAARCTLRAACGLAHSASLPATRSPQLLSYRHQRCRASLTPYTGPSRLRAARTCSVISALFLNTPSTPLIPKQSTTFCVRRKGTISGTCAEGGGGGRQGRGLMREGRREQGGTQDAEPQVAQRPPQAVADVCVQSPPEPHSSENPLSQRHPLSTVEAATSPGASPRSLPLSLPLCEYPPPPLLYLLLSCSPPLSPPPFPGRTSSVSPLSNRHPQPTGSHKPCSPPLPPPPPLPTLTTPTTTTNRVTCTLVPPHLER